MKHKLTYRQAISRQGYVLFVENILIIEEIIQVEILVILGLGIGVAGCVFIFLWTCISGKAEKTFKKKNSSITLSLDREYNQLCQELTTEKLKMYSNDIVLEEKYKSYGDSFSQLCFAKSLKGELVWYEFCNVQKYKINVLRGYEIIPNLPGSIRVQESYPINQIMFFREVGSVQYTTSVSGGGVNLAGAVVGGMVAGAAGAVIGSRQAVTSSTKTHDDRKVVIKFIDGTEKVYDYKYYDYFIKLIPEKEYSFVMAKNQGI